MASSMGVGWTNIRGWVARRRKLAATIGITFRLPPFAQAAMASSRQAKAIL